MQKNEEKKKVRSERQRDARADRVEYREPQEDTRGKPADPSDEPEDDDRMRPEEMGV